MTTSTVRAAFWVTGDMAALILKHESHDENHNEHRQRD
jgi:hypothetical protein